MGFSHGPQEPMGSYCLLQAFPTSSSCRNMRIEVDRLKRICAVEDPWKDLSLTEPGLPLLLAPYEARFLAPLDCNGSRPCRLQFGDHCNASVPTVKYLSVMLESGECDLFRRCGLQTWHSYEGKVNCNIGRNGTDEQ